MRVVSADLPGAKIIEPDVYGDDRGYFLETWNERDYAEAGLEVEFVQDNLSFSTGGVLRGLHFQNPTPQAKLVTVLEGEVFDVAVDLRRYESTFGEWTGVRLSGESHRQFFVPSWCGHGFVVTGEKALFHYKCSDFYSPQDERAIRWDDPTLDIDWPVDEPTLSEKDAAAPFLSDLEDEALF
jgi:dTDP-4-dehydrorhamnose 3,5-epimerase